MSGCAALSSAALNVSEGSDQRGKRRGSHYSIALGSARESWSALLVAAAWGYTAAPSAALRPASITSSVPSTASFTRGVEDQSVLPSGPRTWLRCVIQSGIPMPIIRTPPARNETPNERSDCSASVLVMLGA